MKPKVPSIWFPWKNFNFLVTRSRGDQALLEYSFQPSLAELSHITFYILGLKKKKFEFWWIFFKPPCIRSQRRTFYRLDKLKSETLDKKLKCRRSCSYLLDVPFDFWKQVNELDVCWHEQASCWWRAQWELAVKQLELNHWADKGKSRKDHLQRILVLQMCRYSARNLLQVKSLTWSSMQDCYLWIIEESLIPWTLGNPGCPAYDL